MVLQVGDFWAAKAHCLTMLLVFSSIVLPLLKLAVMLLLWCFPLPRYPPPSPFPCPRHIGCGALSVTLNRLRFTTQFRVQERT